MQHPTVQAPPAPPPGSASWGMGTAALAVAIFLVGQLLVSTVVLLGVVFARGLPNDPDAGAALEQALRDLPTWVTMLAAIIGQAAALAAVGVLVRSRGGSRAAVGLQRPRGRHVAVGFGLGLLGLVGTVVVTAVLHAVLGIDDPAQQSLVEIAGDEAVATVLVVVAAVVVAPVLEELVFRGILLPPMVRRFGPNTGIVLNGVLFAAVHVELLVAGRSGAPSVVALALLGGLLAWSMRRWETLVVPVAAHAAFNGITLAIVIAAA